MRWADDYDAIGDAYRKLQAEKWKGAKPGDPDKKAQPIPGSDLCTTCQTLGACTGDCDRDG